MASMRWVFSDVYARVSDFLGMGLSPTGADLTLVKNLVYRGYLRFLSPLNPATGSTYIWSFLKQTGILVTESGKWIYELPDDFKRFSGEPKLEAGEQYQNPAMRQVDQIYSMRTNDNTTGYPRYWALRSGKYKKDTGQRYEIIFWPSLDGLYRYMYEYIIEPPKVDTDTDYFIGDAETSEAIMACALAAAELQEDGAVGANEADAMRQIVQLIMKDKGTNATSVGMMTDPSILESTVGITRETVRINDIDFTTT